MELFIRTEIYFLSQLNNISDYSSSICLFFLFGQLNLVRLCAKNLIHAIASITSPMNKRKRRRKKIIRNHTKKKEIIAYNWAPSHFFLSSVSHGLIFFIILLNNENQNEPIYPSIIIHTLLLSTLLFIVFYPLFLSFTSW